jgi:hypothetical protein
VDPKCYLKTENLKGVQRRCRNENEVEASGLTTSGLRDGFETDESRAQGTLLRPSTQFPTRSLRHCSCEGDVCCILHNAKWQPLLHAMNEDY